jgi:hypothetical protein
MVYYKYADASNSNKTVFRQSALARILLGTCATSTICILYSLAHARYRKFDISFVKNWIKGGLTCSFLFYTGNEMLLALSKYYQFYTNFWINYSLLAYYLSKLHYKYLIRNRMIKWFEAIQYSHKIFLYFLTANLVIEFVIFLTREFYLYDEPDILDKLKNIKENKTPFTYSLLEENFMKGVHIINSEEKREFIKSQMRSLDNDLILGSEKVGGGAKKFNRIKVVNLYGLYKNNKI